MNQQDLLNEIEKLKKEKKELLNLLEQKTLFLSSVSHEIVTPVCAILGMTNILLEENVNEEQTEILKTLKFSADNLLRLLNDFLIFSKIEAGKIELEEIEINLFELLTNIRQSFSEILKQKDLQFILNIDPKIPNTVIGDPLRISQLLNNLISNAIKFTDSGNITVYVQLKDTKANFVKIEFSVTDTGIGIQKDKLEHIFDNFTQADVAISRKFGGTGLGLAITKKILDLMESEIQVESEPTKGSKFSFNLYLRTPIGQWRNIDQFESTQDKNSLKGLRLLLVEDNIINQKVAIKYFQKWDIEADVANNGYACLDLIQKKEYDVILMDLQMPEMDGYKTTREIRKLENPRLKEIPIIALTAFALLDTKTKVEQAGMNDYLTKPFKPKELYNAIAKHYPKS